MSLTSRELPVANQPHNSKKLKANTSVNVKPDLDDGRNQQKAPTQNDTDREPNKDFETWESSSFCVQEDENEANSQPPRSSEFVQPHQDPFANPPIPSDLHFEGFDWGLPVENQDPPESSGFDLNELLLRPDVRDLLLPPSPSTDPAETEPLDFQNCPVNFDPPEGKYVVDQTDSYISSFPPNCELHDVFNNLDSPDPVCNLTETEGVEELKRSENCESESSNNLPSISGHHPTAPTGIQFNDDDEFYGGPCIDPKVFQILIPKGDISSLENLFTPTTTEDTAEIAPEDPILDATSNEAPQSMTSFQMVKFLVLILPCLFQKVIPAHWKTCQTRRPQKLCLKLHLRIELLMPQPMRLQEPMTSFQMVKLLVLILPRTCPDRMKTFQTISHIPKMQCRSPSHHT